MRGDSDFDPEDFDPRGLWQTQTKEYDAMTLADIHAKARKFESKIQWRNAVEYAACGVVIVGFTPALVFGPNWMMRAGAVLIMAATVYVGWQLHRRASVQASPAPGESLVDAYRRQLIRQRDAIASVGTWYIAPFIPGLAVMMIGMWFRTPKPGVTVEHAHFSLLIAAAVEVVALLVIWLLNLNGARLLQKRIDDL